MTVGWSELLDLWLDQTQKADNAISPHEENAIWKFARRSMTNTRYVKRSKCVAWARNCFELLPLFVSVSERNLRNSRILLGRGHPNGIQFRSCESTSRRY